MAKFLIGTLDGKIRSVHNPPLTFSISNRFVIDVPQDLDVLAKTDSVPELIYEKTVAFRNRPGLSGLTFAQTDELLDVPNIDPALSTRCFVGKNKRCALFPGGTLVTGPVPILTRVSQIWFHWYGFSLWTDQGPQPPASVPERPAPPKVLYNYDPTSESFVEFNYNDLDVEVWNFAYDTKLLDASYETVQYSDPSPYFSWTSAAPVNVRLKFTNNSDKIIHLSDWLFLHDSAP